MSSLSRYIKYKVNAEGKVFETNNFGKCFVLEYRGATNVLVMFYKPKCIVKCTMKDLMEGKVKNPLYPSFYNKGYIGVGEYGGKDKQVYRLWLRLLERAYNENYHLKFPTYEDVEVCEEWLNFQNFAKWCYSQEFYNTNDHKGNTYQLDKDLLCKGNKIYAPETCCFIPAEINGLLIKNDKDRGEYPIGVYPNNDHTKFRAHVSCYGKLKSLGSFSTPEEAFQAYKKAKESHIKLVAEKWKGRIDEKTYKGLLSYEVEIGD